MAKKRTLKKRSSGKRLVCEECGLVLKVDESCGCVDSHAVVCCGTKMKTR